MWLLKFCAGPMVSRPIFGARVEFSRFYYVVSPHWEGTEQSIFDAVLCGNLDFVSNPWPSISSSAKVLVKKMLQADPKSRLTNVEVLNHPWIREDDDAPDKPMHVVVLARMKRFRAMNKLKKVALKKNKQFSMIHLLALSKTNVRRQRLTETRTSTICA